MVDEKPAPSQGRGSDSFLLREKIPQAPPKSRQFSHTRVTCVKLSEEYTKSINSIKKIKTPPSPKVKAIFVENIA